MYKAIIIYSTRTGTTEIMALSIQAGLKESGVEATVKKVEKASKSDLNKADAIVLGCPTYYGDLLPSMKSFLFDMRKPNLKGKVGAAFGPYSWSGESVQMLTDTMKHVFGMNVIEPGLKLLQRPERSDIEACVEFGRKIAAKIKEVKSGPEPKVSIG
jgi:NAD(P)H dehydrogenase (quinone)